MMISEPNLDEIRARWEAVRGIAIEIASGSDGHAKILARQGACCCPFRPLSACCLPAYAPWHHHDRGGAGGRGRGAVGLTQAELAARTGMTQPQLSQLESGGATPTVPLLARLARALGAELDISFRPATAA